MGTLYLVRHGQASFGAENYDQLSHLGHQQSRCLGEFFARAEIQFDRVFTGGLQRHAQTWSGIAQGMGLSEAISSQVLLKPSLKEYDSHALIRCIHTDPLEKPEHREQVQAYFRLLGKGLSHWMQGTTRPQGMPSYADFEKGVVSVLDEVRNSNDKSVLLVSSGGPIATAVGHLLDVNVQARIALNMQIRNSAVSEFHFSIKQHKLLTFNTLPHLDPVVHKSWITYA